MIKREKNGTKKISALQSSLYFEFWPKFAKIKVRIYFWLFLFEYSDIKVPLYSLFSSEILRRWFKITEKLCF